MKGKTCFPCFSVPVEDRESQQSDAKKTHLCFQKHKCKQDPTLSAPTHNNMCGHMMGETGGSGAQVKVDFWPKPHQEPAAETHFFNRNTVTRPQTGSAWPTGTGSGAVCRGPEGGCYAQLTFICHRDGAVEVLLLLIPGCVIHLTSDAAETAAVDFDSCKRGESHFTGNNGRLLFFQTSIRAWGSGYTRRGLRGWRLLNVALPSARRRLHSFLLTRRS